MIGGKDWLDLIVVSSIALGFVTLMIVIQALQHQRSREEIIRGVGLLWAAVALTMVLAWLLEDHWGGALIDVQVYPRPEVVTREITRMQAAILAGMLAAMLGLYIGAIMTVRRLTEPRDGMNVAQADGTDGDAP
jgi:protein-S-isoprenylcysteine O-methyltransferase Ste14